MAKINLVLSKGSQYKRSLYNFQKRKGVFVYPPPAFSSALSSASVKLAPLYILLILFSTFRRYFIYFIYRNLEKANDVEKNPGPKSPTKEPKSKVKISKVQFL